MSNIFNEYFVNVPANINKTIPRTPNSPLRYLDGRYHIAELSKKLAKTCGLCFKVRYLIPTATLITLYNALFLSFLQYGIVARGQTFNSYIDFTC